MPLAELRGPDASGTASRVCTADAWLTHSRRRTRQPGYVRNSPPRWPGACAYRGMPISRPSPRHLIAWHQAAEEPEVTEESVRMVVTLGSAGGFSKRAALSIVRLAA